MVVPSTIELKWLDAAGNLQPFPTGTVDGTEAPKFPSFIVYKKADGTFAVSSLDVLLAAIRDRLPAALAADGSLKVNLQGGASSGVATEATLLLVKAKTDNLDLALTALRDALRGASNKTLSDVATAIESGTTALNASLGSILGAVDGVEVKLDSLIAKDFATDTVLRAVRDRLPAALDADGGLKAHVQNFPTTQAVSAASLPLPAGASRQVDVEAVRDRLPAALDADGGVKTHAQNLPPGASRQVDIEAVRDRLPAALDADGGLKVHAQNLPPTAARQVDVEAVRDRLPAALDADGGLKVHPQSLAPGAATETTLGNTKTSVDTVATRIGDPAGPATGTLLKRLADLLTELQAKADLSETQPVSVASLPLPAGAATQTTLAALLAELELKANLSETQPVSAASLPLPSGAATEATLADIEGDVDLHLKSIANDYKFIEKDLGTGALTDDDPLAAAFDICWVKVVVYDGSDDSLTVKVGSTSSPAIKLSSLVRPDSDVIFVGAKNGRVYLNQGAAQSGKKFRAIVGVRV